MNEYSQPLAIDGPTAALSVRTGEAALNKILEASPGTFVKRKARRSSSVLSPRMPEEFP
jgi:hypothetical protein